MFYSVESFSGKGGETFSKEVPVFINIKPGAAYRAGLISWIEQRPTIAQGTAFGTFTLYHINLIIALTPV